MFCGVSSLKHEDDDASWPTRSRSPKKSRSSREKNPFSNLGLEKFSTMVSDLEAMREKIVAQVGHEDLVLIRFADSSSQGLVPIVVKLNGGSKQAKKDQDRPIQRNSDSGQKSAIGFFDKMDTAPAQPVSDVTEMTLKKSGVFFPRWRPSYYWAVAALILILFCLVMFGRSFAIFCTSGWWYLVPRLRIRNVNAQRFVKKDYGRRLNEKKLGGDLRSDQSKMGTMESSPPRHHLHGRK